MPIDASGGRVLPRMAAAAAITLLAWGCGTRPPAPIEHRAGAAGPAPAAVPLPPVEPTPLVTAPDSTWTPSYLPTTTVVPGHGAPPSAWS